MLVTFLKHATLVSILSFCFHMIAKRSPYCISPIIFKKRRLFYTVASDRYEICFIKSSLIIYQDITDKIPALCLRPLSKVLFGSCNYFVNHRHSFVPYQVIASSPNCPTQSNHLCFLASILHAQNGE